MHKDHLTQVDNLEDLIISEIRKKNNRVLHQVYKTHYPMILNLVMSNNGTEPEAKDVYQEAIIAFYERVQEKDFVLTCKIKTYLYAICKHKWLRCLSDKKKDASRLSNDENFPEMEDEISIVEENEKNLAAMQKSLHALGEPCKTILQDFYIHNLSMEQIRDKFGYTNPDNAKNQKYKCLQRLKKIFFAGV